VAAPTVRAARPADVPAVVALVHELAEYEHAASECRLTEQQLQVALFGPEPTVHGLVVEDPAAPPDAPVVGTALWFLNFSTWEGVAGIHLEDLYVRPEHRGSGCGSALLAALARLAVERGAPRLEWSVLDWNAPSIAFYRALGAEPMEGWTTFRLSGEALRRTASGSGRPRRSSAG
jgi:GNAT superfamily N-acetyltransferase